MALEIDALASSETLPTIACSKSWLSWFENFPQSYHTNNNILILSDWYLHEINYRLGLMFTNTIHFNHFPISYFHQKHLKIIFKQFTFVQQFSIWLDCALRYIYIFIARRLVYRVSTTVEKKLHRLWATIFLWFLQPNSIKCANANTFKCEITTIFTWLWFTLVIVHLMAVIPFESIVQPKSRTVLILFTTTKFIRI